MRRCSTGRTSKKLIDKAKIPSGTETDLLSQLHSGELDYAWEYQSTSASHDVNTVDLQPSVDLSKASAKYDEHYAKAEVKAGGETYTGAPIAYGVAVPDDANGRRRGQRVGRIPHHEARTQDTERTTASNPSNRRWFRRSTKDAVPKGVVANAEAKTSIGPLEL